MIRAVLLDIDGTLVDSIEAHARAYEDAFREVGMEISRDELRRAIGLGSDKLMPRYLDASEHEGFLKRRGEILQERYMPDVRALDGAQELVAALKERGLRLAIGSSASIPELARLKKIAGIEDLVQEEVTADDVEHTKPDPDVWLADLKKLGVPGDQAIALGDTPFDIESAAKAGVRTIAILGGAYSGEEMTAAGAVESYASPRDLLNRLDGSILTREAA